MSAGRQAAAGLAANSPWRAVNPVETRTEVPRVSRRSTVSQAALVAALGSAGRTSLSMTSM